MRRCKQAGAVAGRAQDGLREGADRAFAFGARDVYNMKMLLWIPQVGQQGPHAFQVECGGRIVKARLALKIDAAKNGVQCIEIGWIVVVHGGAIVL